jgi:hypothetical protein
MEVTGQTLAGGTTASIFTSTRLDDAAVTDVSLYSKGPSGVAEHASAGVDPALAQLYPNQAMAFPLAPGSSYEKISCTGLDYGADLDGDGRNERMDVSSTVTVVGDEIVAVAAGRFTATVVETRTVITIHASSGQEATAVAEERQWYAPGVGRVRWRNELDGGGAVETQEGVLAGWVGGEAAGGIVAIKTLATDLADSDSPFDVPGQPALSFDGRGHLLACLYTPGRVGPTSVRGWILAPDGTPGPAITIADRSVDWPATAFNGTSHLVVSTLQEDDPSRTIILAQRVTPDGMLLDGTGGFTVQTGVPSITGRPSVASDGSGWLVTSATYTSGLQAAMVSPSGIVTVSPVPGHRVTGETAVAFGGGVYLVVWREETSVYALRFARDGTVLDANPLVVSASPGTKRMGGVAFDGTRFLVVWSDTRRGDTSGGLPARDVWAARVQPDGVVLDGDPATGGIAVNTLPGETKLDPGVAWVGDAYVITWWIGRWPPLVGVFTTRVSADGVLLDGPASEPGIPLGLPGEPAWYAVHPVVAPTGRSEALLAWTTTQGRSTRKSIDGAWFVFPPR